MARIGWSTEDGSLDLGTDGNGFGYGADHDGFSIAGDRGKKMFNNEIENYGVVRCVEFLQEMTFISLSTFQAYIANVSDLDYHYCIW